ncbi:MAG: NAD(P)/FAD-dependent oxidoreductase [Myxococcota bacterium]
MERHGVAARPDDGVGAAVIGAGVVGCAIASLLARRGLSVALLEAAEVEGTGVSSRNSGVIHSGLYYPPGTLKARTCVRGQRLLYEWAEAREVPVARRGKLVVARGAEQREALHALEVRARDNGAREIRMLGADEVRRLEPSLPPVDEALWCPWTGVVDVHALVHSLRVDAERHGALVAFGAPVARVEPGGGGFALETGRGRLWAERLINAAGMDADRLARRVGWEDAPEHHPSRGDYFRLAGRTGWRRLVYPVRVPGDPGLGVHLTLDLDGRVRLGPDARWVARRDDFSPPDEGLRATFHEAGQRLIGPFPEDALSWDGCGIRPKLRAPDEPEDRDFLVAEAPDGAVHLLGIESPGVTAALALAEVVAERLGVS